MFKHGKTFTFIMEKDMKKNFKTKEDPGPGNRGPIACTGNQFPGKFYPNSVGALIFTISKQINGGFLLGTSVSIPVPPLRTLRITDNIHYSYQLIRETIS